MSLNFEQILSSLQLAIQPIFNNMLGALLGSLGGKRDLAQITNIIQNTFNVSLKQLIEKLKAIYIKYQAVVQQFLGNPSLQPQLSAATFTAKVEIEKGISEFFTSIQGFLAPAINTVIAAGINLFGKRGIFDGFGDIISNLTATLGGHLDNITSSLVSVGSNLVGAVTPHLQDLQDQLTNHALNAAQSLLGTLSNISGSLQG